MSDPSRLSLHSPSSASGRVIGHLRYCEMSKIVECRGRIWPNLLIKAAKLRKQRKAIEVVEKNLKKKIKAHMRENGIDQWVTLSGYKAVLEERKGRPKWLQKKLATALRISIKGLDQYKERGKSIYALTIYEP